MWYICTSWEQNVLFVIQKDGCKEVARSSPDALHGRWRVFARNIGSGLEDMSRRCINLSKFVGALFTHIVRVLESCCSVRIHAGTSTWNDREWQSALPHFLHHWLSTFFLTECETFWNGQSCRCPIWDFVNRRNCSCPCTSRGTVYFWTKCFQVLDFQVKVAFLAAQLLRFHKKSAAFRLEPCSDTSAFSSSSLNLALNNAASPQRYVEWLESTLYRDIICRRNWRRPRPLIIWWVFFGACYHSVCLCVYTILCVAWYLPKFGATSLGTQ